MRNRQKGLCEDIVKEPLALAKRRHMIYNNFHETYRSICRYAKKEVKFMKKYVCEACGYIYDPAVGDDVGGIAPGTAFEDLPEDWECPECGVDKSLFSEKADA